MHHNKFKKLISILLAVGVIFSSGAFAFAEEFVPPGNPLGDMEIIESGIPQNESLQYPQDNEEAVENLVIDEEPVEYLPIDGEIVPEMLMDIDYAPLSILEPGITIKRVEVLNGGQYHIQWRDARKWDVSIYTVYKGDDLELADSDHNPDRYYTTSHIVNMQDARAFYMDIVIPKGDYTGIGTDAGQFNPANVTFAYSQNGNNPIIGTTTAGTANLPNARTGVFGATIDGDFIVIDAVVSFDGIGWSTGAVSFGTNALYSPRFDNGRPSTAVWARQGYWPLVVSYGGSEITRTMLRTAMSDAHMSWREMDAWSKDFLNTYGAEGTTEISDQGRYITVESIGKSIQGKDLWSWIIADSKESVDYYLNVTVPLMNSNPALMQQQIADGVFNHKGVLMFSAIHGNEVQGNGLFSPIRERLLQKDTIKFGVRDKSAVVWVPPTSATNASGGTRLSSAVTASNYSDTVNTFELDVDEFLDNYIVVILPWVNPDGNDIPQRANNYGQDPNRDGGMFAFPETRAYARTSTKWDPIYFAEFHDDVNTFQIDGCTPPTEASLEADIIDNYMVKLLEAVQNGALANGFTSTNIPTRDMINDWDAGALMYSASVAMMNGGLGSTWEFPMNNQDAMDAGLGGVINLMHYMFTERDGLYTNKLEFKRRGVENIDAKDKVDPLLSNVHWAFKEPATWSQLSTTVQNWIINNEVAQPRPRSKDADGNELSFFPEYWILPIDAKLQFNPSGAAEALIMMHELGGVEISRLTEQVWVDGVRYPVGTYVIDMRQGHRSWAHSVLYAGFDAAIYGSALYDTQTSTSWPSQKGFNAYQTWDAGAFKGKLEPAALTPRVNIPGNGQYVIYTNAGQDTIRLTNRLLKDGRDAWMVTGYIPGAALGDIIARRADVLEMAGPKNNAVWGPRALSIYGVDGGNAAPDGSRATKLVKPVIAVAQPGATAIMRFVYDSLEFDDSSYFNSSYTGPGAVFVGTASTAASANIPQFLYGITAANLSAANALGTDAVAAKTMSGTAEIVGKADWSGSSIIASNFGPYDQIFSFSNNKYTSLRSDVKQLAAFSNVPDVYLGGRKGAASGNNGNVQGSVMAVTGIRPGSNTQVTAINEDITTRARFQTGWLLMANAILSGAAGITDVPRPVVYADVKTAFWTFEDINVQLEVLAEDTAGINATVAVKKYKINLNPLEPAYDAADADWIDIPADGKVSVDKPGVYYIHWFVENSKGVSSQGTFGPYMKNGPDYATTSTKNFVSMVETAKNSRIWVLTFNYVQTYLDGASEVFTYSINLNGNNANLDGAYKFTNGPLAGYTLVYDIKGNGSNIKDLRLI